jgi:hypothetical protein
LIPNRFSIDPKRALDRFLPPYPSLLSFTFSLLIRRFHSKYILKMSSILEPDLSLTPSVTVESTTTNQTHGKKRSPVWAHCRRPIQDENQAFLYCSHCVQDSTPPPYSTASSGNMLKHINRHHPKITIKKALSKNQEAVNQQLKQLYR